MIFTKKTKSIFVSNIFIIIILVIFLTTRLKTALPKSKEFFSSIKEMLVDKRHYNYHQKMVDFRGPHYVYLKHINDVVPPETDILFPTDHSQPILQPIVAAYFLFPRTITVINPEVGLNTPSSEYSKDKFTRSILLIDGFPNFPIKSKQIFIFNNELDSPVQIYKDKYYYPEDPSFKDKIGIIQFEPTTL